MNELNISKVVDPAHLAGYLADEVVEAVATNLPLAASLDEQFNILGTLGGLTVF